jgi:hypothetical protein
MIKIDIIYKNINQLISTNEDVLNTYELSDLQSNQKDSYDLFHDLCESKKQAEYNQVYVSEYPLKRFVLLTTQNVETTSIEEFLYDDLSASEKTVFDDFWNAFIS